MDDLLLDDLTDRENEKTNPTPRVYPIVNDVIEEEDPENTFDLER
jgi:hypothetical protein